MRVAIFHPFLVFPVGDFVGVVLEIDGCKPQFYVPAWVDYLRKKNPQNPVNSRLWGHRG